MNAATALVLLVDIVNMSLEGKNRQGIAAIANVAADVLRTMIEQSEQQAKEGASNGDQPKQSTELG